MSLINSLSNSEKDFMLYKHKKEVFVRIIDKWINGENTLADAIRSENINYVTFQRWREKYADLAELFFEADALFREIVTMNALDTVRQAIKGTEIKEVIKDYKKDINGKDVLKGYKEITKQIKPDAELALKFLNHLKGLTPEGDSGNISLEFNLSGYSQNEQNNLPSAGWEDADFQIINKENQNESGEA